MPKQRTARTGADQGADAGVTPPKSQMPNQGQGGSMVDAAKDKAQTLANQAQDKVSQQLDSGLRTGKNRAAGALDGIAQSLIFSSQQLREQDQQGISRYAEQAASKVEQLADYMQNTNVGEVADRVENFARREPAMFLGGAFALGLLGARFLKSSRREQQQGAADSAYLASRAGAAPELSLPRSAAADREIPRSRAPGDRPVTRTDVPSPGVTGTTRSGAGGLGSTTGPTG